MKLSHSVAQTVGVSAPSDCFIGLPISKTLPAVPPDLCSGRSLPIGFLNHAVSFPISWSLGCWIPAIGPITWPWTLKSSDTSTPFNWSITFINDPSIFPVKGIRAIRLMDCQCSSLSEKDMLNVFHWGTKSTFPKTFCDIATPTQDVWLADDVIPKGQSSGIMQLTTECHPYTCIGIIGVSSSDCHCWNTHGVGSHYWQG